MTLLPSGLNAGWVSDNFPGKNVRNLNASYDRSVNEILQGNGPLKEAARLPKFGSSAVCRRGARVVFSTKSCTSVRGTLATESVDTGRHQGTDLAWKSELAISREPRKGNDPPASLSASLDGK